VCRRGDRACGNEAAGKFEMLINMKTDNALGVSAPPSMLDRDDDLME
jgi:hypothetical protein